MWSATKKTRSQSRDSDSGSRSGATRTAPRVRNSDSSLRSTAGRPNFRASNAEPGTWSPASRPKDRSRGSDSGLWSPAVKPADRRRESAVNTRPEARTRIARPREAIITRPSRASQASARSTGSEPGLWSGGRQRNARPHGATFSQPAQARQMEVRADGSGIGMWPTGKDVETLVDEELIRREEAERKRREPMPHFWDGSRRLKGCMPRSCLPCLCRLRCYSEEMSEAFSMPFWRRLQAWNNLEDAMTEKEHHERKIRELAKPFPWWKKLPGVRRPYPGEREERERRLAEIKPFVDRQETMIVNWEHRERKRMKRPVPGYAEIPTGVEYEEFFVAADYNTPVVPQSRPPPDHSLSSEEAALEELVVKEAAWRKKDFAHQDYVGPWRHDVPNVPPEHDHRGRYQDTPVDAHREEWFKTFWRSQDLEEDSKRIEKRLRHIERRERGTMFCCFRRARPGEQAELERALEEKKAAHVREKATLARYEKAASIVYNSFCTEVPMSGKKLHQDSEGDYRSKQNRALGRTKEKCRKYEQKYLDREKKRKPHKDPAIEAAHQAKFQELCEMRAKYSRETIAYKEADQAADRRYQREESEEADTFKQEERFSRPITRGTWERRAHIFDGWDLAGPSRNHYDEFHRPWCLARLCLHLFSEKYREKRRERIRPSNPVPPATQPEPGPGPGPGGLTVREV